MFEIQQNKANLSLDNWLAKNFNLKATISWT